MLHIIYKFFYCFFDKTKLIVLLTSNLIPSIISLVYYQVLDALEHLHMMNVVYLDLRHDNLLMESRRKDVVRLIDFGSCRVIQKDGESKTKGIDVLPEFMG